MKVVLVRAVHFSSGYRYFDEALSAEENAKRFGSMHLPAGVGCNLRLEAYWSGPIDPLTGMIENLSVIDRWLKQVTAELDHHYLNRDVAHFRNHVPTVENIAIYCFSRLQQIMAAPEYGSVAVDPATAAPAAAARAAANAANAATPVKAGAVPAAASGTTAPPVTTAHLEKVRLYEGDTTWVEYSGG